MGNDIQFTVGQYSNKGIKEINQDFHGVLIPDVNQQHLKGVAMAVADGISTSNLSHIASKTAVNSFFNDYFCTPDVWSVKKSGLQVLAATNAWLNALTKQSQFRFDKDRGYVCTFSALILKSSSAHIFHVGDSRIYRIRNKKMECLTEDHRQKISQQEYLLSRALGFHEVLEADYKVLGVEPGDLFILSTDGIFEWLSDPEWFSILDQHPFALDYAARCLTEKALQNGSDDNLTLVLFRVDQLGIKTSQQLHQHMTELPFAPALDVGSTIDGFEILRELQSTSRSHVYLARELQSNHKLVLKFPSIDQRDNQEYLERFLLEEWIARRLNSPHIVKAYTLNRVRNFIYVATEYIDGQTLGQWFIDNPNPGLEVIRDIVEQIAKGLHAFHRMEMLHQDIRPENILIDSNHRITIIDFGSTHVAGLVEIDSPLQRQQLLGTALYTAPEYFLGNPGLPQSDLFSLAVITYQLLSGKFPYGTEIAKTRTQRAQDQLVYRSVLHRDREIPAWIDEALRKALHPNPYKRYENLSEFTADLRRPSQAFLNKTKPALIERNPLAFWKGVSLILLLLVFFLAYQLQI